MRDEVYNGWQKTATYDNPSFVVSIETPVPAERLFVNHCFLQILVNLRKKPSGGTVWMNTQQKLRSKLGYKFQKFNFD